MPAVATGRRGYTPGEPIAVSWSDAPGNAWDWIGLYAPGAATDVEEPLAYAMTYGRPAGTARLDADLAPGPYLVGLFLDDTGTLLAATEIEVR